MKHSEKEWEKFGKEEPYYSIMCDNRFRKDQFDEILLTKFFKSGEDFVKYIIEKIQNIYAPTFIIKNVLDFGCGVGRCVVPLAKFCQHVVGVDISESMLREAKINAAKHSIMNAEFIKSDDLLSKVSGFFDLIVSFEVFHNISPKKGYTIFSNLVKHLSEDGFMVIDFLFYREEPFYVKLSGKLRKVIPGLNNIVNLFLKRPIQEPLIEKNIYNINKLLYILSKKSCSNIHVEFYNKAHKYHLLLFSQKKDNNNFVSEFL